MASAEERSEEPGAQPAWDGPFSKSYTGYVLGVIFLVMVFNNLDRTILSILVKPIKAEFGFSDTQMGLLMGPAFAAVYTLTALPLARLADFHVRRTIVASGLFLWSLFTAATSLASGFWSLFSMRMGVGIGEAAGTAPSVSMLTDAMPPRLRASGLSVVSIGAVVGMGLGMIVGGWINVHYGWRVAFVAAGLPGIALALLLSTTVTEPPRGGLAGVGAGGEGESVRESVRYLLESRTYRYIIGANAFALFAAMGRNLWEPTFIIRSYQLDTAWAGLWYFVTSPLPSVLGVYLGGRFADRLGARDKRWFLWVPAFGQAVSVPILIAFILWPASHVWQMPAPIAALGLEAIPVAFVLSFVGSIFGSFFTAPFMATIQGVARLRMRALAAAVSTTVSTLVGLCAGPLLVGVVSDAFQARFGDEALRYSLLIPTAAPLLSSLVCVFGASSVAADLALAKARDAGDSSPSSAPASAAGR